MLEIPKLGKKLPILAVCEDSLLDIAPGLFSGNPYFGNMVIGGHNSQAHLAGLDQLAPGDDITFTDFNDIVWKYKVAGNEVLAPKQGNQLMNSKYELSIFNCTWDNSSRFVVRCSTAGK